MLTVVGAVMVGRWRRRDPRCPINAEQSSAGALHLAVYVVVLHYHTMICSLLQLPRELPCAGPQSAWHGEPSRRLLTLWSYGESPLTSFRFPRLCRLYLWKIQ